MRKMIMITAASITALAGVLGSINPVRASSPLDRAAALTYCGGKAIKRQITFRIDPQPKSGELWDASIFVNGKTIRPMTAFSYFGTAQKPPGGFLVALLGEDRSEVLIFSKGGNSWLELGDYRYAPYKTSKRGVPIKFGLNWV